MSSKTAKEAFFLLLRAKSTYLILTCITLVSILAFYLFIHQNPREILSKKNKLEAQFFGDAIDGGNSEVLDKQITDSSISIKYILKKGFINPYAGMTFTSFENQRDFSVYNKIQLKAEGKNIDNIYVHVITQDEAVKNTEHRLANRLSEINLTLTKGIFDQSIALDRFETPSWWYHTIKQPESDFKEINWDKVVKISVITGVPPALDQIQELKIFSIVFYKDYSNYYFAFAILLLATFLSLYAYQVFALRIKKHPSLIIEYHPTLEDGNKAEDEFNIVLNFIHKNYFDSDLTLTKIAQETGAQERIISKLISEKYDCNFRSYINRIRIAEAERLLKSSDLSVSEIAYKVGFNDPSFFSKTFKKITGKTPSASN